MFEQLSMAGVFQVLPRRNTDQRGSVTKIFERTAFESMGIDCAYNETLIARNQAKGVLRGFHFQYPPYAQAKLMHCLSGACTCYLLDLRRGSPTYKQIEQLQVSEALGNVLLVPVGVANAYFIEQDNTTILYQLTAQYHPEAEGGIRWDSVNLDLAYQNPIVSAKDMRLPALEGFVSPFTWGEQT